MHWVKVIFQVLRILNEFLASTHQEIILEFHLGRNRIGLT